MAKTKEFMDQGEADELAKEARRLLKQAVETGMFTLKGDGTKDGPTYTLNGAGMLDLLKYLADRGTKKSTFTPKLEVDLPKTQ